MPRNGPIFHLHPPDLRDTRNGASLLVWGGLAQWLIVDAELDAFLSLFDGWRDLGAVTEEHARRTGRPPDLVRAEAGAIVNDLCRRGVLYESLPHQASPPEEIRIANVTVNITNRCNLKCRWCYNADRNTAELAVGPLMDGIASGAPLYTRETSLFFLGGEPFLDMPRLTAALDRAERMFTPPVLVSTNGTLLDDRAIAAMQGRNVEIQVSLDGGTAALHEATRGPGTFAKTLSGIRRLVAAEVPTILSMVYARGGEDAFEQYLDLALELGVREARLIPLRVIGRGLSCADQLPRQDEAFDALRRLILRRPELGRLLGRDFFSILMAVCAQTGARTHCGIGRNVVFVDADGAVYACPNHVCPELRCGTLPGDSLADTILHSPVMQSIRQRYDVKNYPNCRTCPFRRWCAGDCRGEVFAVTGDPLAPSPHCGELKRVMTEMLWLLAENPEPFGRKTAAQRNAFL